MYFYLHPKKNIAMPKFMKISGKEKRINEIMTFTEISLGEKIRNFYDESPCLKLRKFFYKYIAYINRFSLKLVKNPIYDNFFLFVILLNTVFLLISEPNDPTSIADITDEYFLYVYSFEMFVKIFAYGFILLPNSYLKDTWNILDFTVVVVSWISYLIEKTSGGAKIQGLAGLRTFRILRPLKTVKSIKGLRRIISTLLESMLALGDILIVLIFFFLIFAVAAVQMWQGNFKQRCTSKLYGYPLDISNPLTMCTNDSDCIGFNSFGQKFYCAKTSLNPEFNYSSFDDTINAMIGIFMISTMEGWTAYYNYTCNTFRDTIGINITIIILYYHVLIIISGYYLINLFLAVILNKFSEVEAKNNTKKNKKISLYNILMETFDKNDVEVDENENENENDKANRDNIDEEDLETLDEMKEKLKKKVGIFEYENDEISASYENLSKIFFLKRCSPQELYYIKQNVYGEAKKALKEYNEVLISQILKNKEKLSIRKKAPSKIKIEGKKDRIKEILNLKNIKPANYGSRSIIDLMDKIKIDKSGIKNGLERTLNFFSDIVKNIKIDTDKRIKEKKIMDEQNKKKTRLEMLKEKIEENEKTQINSDDESDKEENFDKGKSNNETNKAISKINLVTVNQDKEKLNLSFSVDTSDDDSANESNLENKNNKKSDNSIKNNGDKKENVYKKCKNKRDILVNKKDLIDKENNIYNTVVVNKPYNPMSSLNKLKEQKVREKRKEILKEKFDAGEYAKDMKPLVKNRLTRGISFLNMLKHTPVADQIFNKDTRKEIKDYNEELDDMESLEISGDDEQALVVDTNSNINEEDINNLKSNEDDKFIDFEKYAKKYKNNKSIDVQKKIDPKRSSFRSQVHSRDSISILQKNTSQALTSIKKQLNNNDEINGFKLESFYYNPKVKDDNEIIKQDEDKNRELILFEGFKSYQKSPSILKNLQIMGNSNKKKTRRIRSFSLRKNGFKFSDIEKINSYDDMYDMPQLKSFYKKGNFYNNYEKENISDDLTRLRKYQRMLNFFIDKDFKIKSEFDCDDYIEDVMGKADKNISMKNLESVSIDPLKMFNSSNVYIKKSAYINYLKTDSELFRFFDIANNLKHLSPYTFNKISPNNLDFRTSEKFGVKSKHHHQHENTIFIEGNVKNRSMVKPLRQNEFTTIRESSYNQGSIHISKSMNYHDMKFNKNNIKLIERIKLNESKEIFTKFLDMEYSEKLKNFFLIDKPKSHKNIKIPQIKIEFHIENYDVKNEIRKIRNFDNEMNIGKYKDWSAQQVMLWKDDEENYEEWNHLIKTIENSDIILWSKNLIKKFLIIIKYVLFKISISKIFDTFIIFIVLINIVLMIIDGNLLDPEILELLQLSNYAFNGVFILEFVVKFIGLGPVIYFSDAFTYLDLGIIGFGILDMVSSPPPNQEIIIKEGASNTNIASQLGFLRVFRIFRVTRIAKILKKIKSFRKVIIGIRRSISNVSYNLLIVLIFLLIFQLLGMNLLNQNTLYKGFLGSFYTTFQVLTMENWNSVYYSLANTYNRLVIFYIIIWIFLGNYVLFNLFISILLSSFEIEEDEDEELPESIPDEFRKLELMQKEIIKSKKEKNKKRKENEDKNKSKNKIYDEKENSDSDEEGETKHIDQNMKFNKYKGGKKFMKEREIKNKVFKENECEYSLFLFDQTNAFRLWCIDLITLKSFDNIILLMILLSTLRLIIGTFIEGELSTIILDAVDVFFIFIFLFEMVMKIISLGFVMGEGTYLKDNWNRIDFIICCVSIIDLQGILGKYSLGSESSGSLNFLRVLRILRTLRPLRFISHNVQLKIIINSLFDSIIPIGNVLIIVLVIIIVFSIVGMNLFSDVYNTCYIEDPNKKTPFIAVQNFTDIIYNSLEAQIDAV
jgi:hypothetical protein